MTPQEKRQPKAVFVNAGKHAFMIGVHFLDNPYKQQPYKLLWEKGYNVERKKYVKKAPHKKANLTRINHTT